LSRCRRSQIGHFLSFEALECPLQSGRSWVPEATQLAAISTRGPVRVAIAPIDGASESSQRHASDAFSRSNDHPQSSSVVRARGARYSKYLIHRTPRGPLPAFSLSTAVAFARRRSVFVFRSLTSTVLEDWCGPFPGYHTSITRAAASRHRRLLCWSMRCATGVNATCGAPSGKGDPRCEWNAFDLVAIQFHVSHPRNPTH